MRRLPDRGAPDLQVRGVARHRRARQGRLPPPRVRRLLAVAALVGGLVLPLAAQTPSSTAAAGAPVVYSATVDAIIHPVSAEFMTQTMDRADAAGAALLVFTLRTPGGLLDSTRDIITHMLAARTPVAVFVGPSGARAASAGFIITMAADIAAMAPGTNIGAAHPVQGNGQAMDETESKKAAEDTAAWVRTLTGGRGRNVALAEQAVMESKAFTEHEAMDATPPLIDLIVPDVPTLVQRLDGRQVRRFDGHVVTLHTAGARIVPVEMSTRQRVLSTIAHPNIAFILMSLGVLGLTVELWSPGAVLPGVAGGICLLLAFFALQLLPVNVTGVLLVLLGLLLLALEIKVASYGLLTAGGVISLVLGSMMMMDSPDLGIRLSLEVVAPVVIGCVAIAVFLARLALMAQRRRAVTGSEGMMGELGETLSAITPEHTGQVRIRGEIWRATATTPFEPGTRVRVTAIEGLTVTIEKV